MLVTCYHNNNHVTFYRIFYTATKQEGFTSKKAADFKTHHKIIARNWRHVLDHNHMC